jgi:hypothetical protein
MCVTNGARPRREIANDGGLLIIEDGEEDKEGSQARPRDSSRTTRKQCFLSIGAGIARSPRRDHRVGEKMGIGCAWRC